MTVTMFVSSRLSSNISSARNPSGEGKLGYRGLEQIHKQHAVFLERTEGRPQTATVHEFDDRKELFELVFERRTCQYKGNVACFLRIWSGRWEPNPRPRLGKLGINLLKRLNSRHLAD